MRDGVPLPGRSPTEVLSQLVYRVFGPLHSDRVRVVLDYHGLDRQPAGRLAEVAARQHVTSRTCPTVSRRCGPPVPGSR